MTNHNLSEEQELLVKAQNVALEIEGWSSLVDESGEFPIQSFNALRRGGLMGILIPKKYGGGGASLSLFSKICQIVGGACLSSGMLWAMHAQQTAILRDFANEALKKRILPRIASGEIYVVSVTSSKNNNQGVFTAESTITKEEGNISFERHAPTVSGAAHGDAFLITIRESADKPNLTFVYAEKDQVQIQVNPTWNSMGMRGTQSCEMSLKGSIPFDQLISPDGGFDRINQISMVPIGHVAWASTWLGAVKSSFIKSKKIIRSSSSKSRLNHNSDLFLEKVARIRMKLGIVDNYISEYIKKHLIMISSTDERGKVQDIGLTIEANNLKILSSELLCECVDELVQLMGVRDGYLKNSEIPLERLYRDIRSARLMINNFDLLTINGKLSLVENYKIY